MAAAIEIQRLWKFYGDYPALRDLSLYGPEDVKRLRREKFLAIGRLEGAA